MKGRSRTAQIKMFQIGIQKRTLPYACWDGYRAVCWEAWGVYLGSLGLSEVAYPWNFLALTTCT